MIVSTPTRATRGKPIEDTELLESGSEDQGVIGKSRKSDK